MTKRVLLLFFIMTSFIMLACNNKAASSVSDNDVRAENVVENTHFTVQSGLVIPTDTFCKNEQPLYVTLVGHASLMFEYEGKIIHVDPYSAVADYSKLPKADLILLTHEHSDHLDKAAIDAVKRENTDFIVSKTCNEILGYGSVIGNGDTTQWKGIDMVAIPAYNIVHKKSETEYYHPKGVGNGYILTFGQTKVYIAGDTENIREMESLKGTIDIAFLPKNIPYTMDDEMFIDAARKVMPKNLYPYHMSELNESKIRKALDETGIKINVRPMSNK